MEAHSYDFQRGLLLKTLTQVFGEFDQTMLSMIEPMLEWVEIGGGETLFHQHEPGESLYFVISGRLQAFVTDDDGRQHKLGEIIRGETVGELAIFTGEPRSATIAAIRDSVLVRLSKTVFEQVITAYPGVSMNVTKLIIKRLQHKQTPRVPVKKPVNICLLAVHETVDLHHFTQQFETLLATKGPVYLASSETIDAAHKTPNFAQTLRTDSMPYRQLSQWLDEQESRHEYMLYIADQQRPGQASTSEWTQRCLRQADEILLLADATQAPDLTVVEQQYLSGHSLTGATQMLILLHPADTLIPRHTAQWLLARPPVQAHYHLRLGSTRDIARLVRLLSGTAIGLVLAGGGAKGFAHLGVLQALQEFGIPVDMVGGTSIGALVAAAVSFDQPAEITRTHLRKSALFNPTKDYNLLPFMSLIGGKRMVQILKTAVYDFVGHSDLDLEDSWLTLFTLSSNYSRAREEIHRRGPLVKYLQASSAIPGVFPPVIDGDDLLIDGGTFNNFPADVMSRLGVGKVIGVDLVIDKPRRMTLTVMPSQNQLLRDRFRHRSLKKYRLPSLVSIILNTTLLYSSARRNETRRYLDLAFNPDVSRYGLMEWASFDKIVDAGYDHALTVLRQLSPHQLAALQGK